MFKEANNTTKIAVPLIISNVSQMALGIIDSAMIGAVDYRQLAAAALVINVLTIPHVLAIGMTMAISPLVASANGKGDALTASKVLYNGFVLSSLFTVLIVATMILAKGILFRIGQDPDVANFAEEYFVVMACSLIPMIMFHSIKQFSDALEFTRVAMILGLLSMPLNAFLNWIFIYGHWGMPRLELLGTGISTLITRVVILIVLIVVLFRHKIFKPYIQLRHQGWYINKKTFKEILRIGIPSSLQYSMEAGAFAVSGIMIGWLGATVQAAHQISLELASMTFMASLGLSAAGSIRIANAHGRNDQTLIRKIGTSTIAVGLFYGLICALFFIIFRHSLPKLFNNNVDVLAIATTLLVWGALFQISDATQAIGVGLLRGIRDVKLPTVFVAIAYWVIGIPVGYFLAFPFGMGASGIWIGFVSGLTVSSILLNYRFLSKSKLKTFQR